MMRMQLKGITMTDIDPVWRAFYRGKDAIRGDRNSYSEGLRSGTHGATASELSTASASG